MLTVASHEALVGGGVETVAQTGLVERLRAVKEPAEIETLRQAGAISDAVFGALAEERFVGRTERELSWRVRELFHEHGSSELSFDTAVASAENGASPHAEVRDVAIPANTLVTIDAGCRVDGYASDCTRTYATGDLPDELARAYEVCLEAQLGGLEAIGPGVSGRDADAGSRDVIAAAGWGEQYGHGMGHGHRARGARGARPAAGVDRRARAGERRQLRARHLPARRRRRANRGHGARHRRRPRAAHSAREGARHRSLV